MELNQLTAQASVANANMTGVIKNLGNFSDQEISLFTGGSGWNSGSMDDNMRSRYGAFTQFQTRMKADNEVMLAQLKNQIEEKYENMNDYMLEPLKQEQDSLQTEKDSLESQIQIANADYEACKKMESADAKNLAPNYTGQG